MSDPKSERKEEADAPAGPRNPWVGWLVWAILAPVLYVLSVGPAYWLCQKGYVGWDAGVVVYLPLSYFPEHSQDLLRQYMEWWTP